MRYREKCRDKSHSQWRESHRKREGESRANRQVGRRDRNRETHAETETQRHCPTGAAEFLALDLSDAFVRKTARAGTAGAAGLNGVGAQIVCQPLQITVTNKWVLSQVPGEQRAAGGVIRRGKGTTGRRRQHM